MVCKSSEILITAYSEPNSFFDRFCLASNQPLWVFDKVVELMWSLLSKFWPAAFKFMVVSTKPLTCSPCDSFCQTPFTSSLYNGFDWAFYQPLNDSFYQAINQPLMLFSTKVLTSLSPDIVFHQGGGVARRVGERPRRQARAAQCEELLPLREGLHKDHRHDHGLGHGHGHSHGLGHGHGHGQWTFSELLTFVSWVKIIWKDPTGRLDRRSLITFIKEDSLASPDRCHHSCSHHLHRHRHCQHHHARRHRHRHDQRGVGRVWSRVEARQGVCAGAHQGGAGTGEKEGRDCGESQVGCVCSLLLIDKNAEEVEYWVVWTFNLRWLVMIEMIDRFVYVLKSCPWSFFRSILCRCTPCLMFALQKIDCVWTVLLRKAHPVPP